MKGADLDEQLPSWQVVARVLSYPKEIPSSSVTFTLHSHIFNVHYGSQITWSYDPWSCPCLTNEDTKYQEAKWLQRNHTCWQRFGFRVINIINKKCLLVLSMYQTWLRKSFQQWHKKDILLFLFAWLRLVLTGRPQIHLMISLQFLLFNFWLSSLFLVSCKSKLSSTY